MMEGASNGGMLYHEVQESKLCAVHCVNTVLQGPFFSEFDLAALASDLDRKERQVMLPALSSADFESHNVSLDGDFSIQVRLGFFLRSVCVSLSCAVDCGCVRENVTSLWRFGF
uniref:ubiquitinyl hydrolase 1 n=1 Tax=Cajanus cajan TaxID=3821 RepID=A0A151RAM0_CAJCA|nr:Ataxin-3 isogeny [Cajanus cajan]